MKSCKAFCVSWLVMLAYASPAYSGGTSWSFKVKSIVKVNTNFHHLLLIPINDSLQYQKDSFPYNCSQLVVYARYDSRHSNSSFDFKSYAKAIAFITAAGSSGRDFHFGEIGLGLKPHHEHVEEQDFMSYWLNKIRGIFTGGKSQPLFKRGCKVHSKGLAILEEYDKQLGVYSYYEPF